MNIFRLIADLLHLLSFIIIIYKLHVHRSAKGIFKFNFIGVSCKTQEIYLVVFCTRYLDLLMYFISLYNTTMKILFISVTVYIIYLLRFQSPIKSVNIYLFLRHTTESKKMIFLMFI